MPAPAAAIVHSSRAAAHRRSPKLTRAIRPNPESNRSPKARINKPPFSCQSNPTFGVTTSTQKKFRGPDVVPSQALAPSTLRPRPGVCAIDQVGNEHAASVLVGIMSRDGESALTGRSELSTNVPSRTDGRHPARPHEPEGESTGRDVI